MAGFAADSPLGKISPASDHYDPQLLFPIAREQARQELGLTAAALPFVGADLWTAYELSWLDSNGQPRVAIAEVVVPADSTHLIESKSFKLYLNSFNFARLGSVAEVQQLLQQDLSQAVAAPVQVAIFSQAEYAARQLGNWDAICLDKLSVACDAFQPDPNLIQVQPQMIAERVYTDVFRSCCPVTGQPDWGSVLIAYHGPALDHASLLRYLVSYRQHTGFHEQCVEQIYMDLQRLAQPRQLTVYARYLRRGGLDINPWRSSHQPAAFGTRLARQ